MTLSFVLPEPFQVCNLISTITLLRLCPPLSPTLRHIHRILQVHEHFAREQIYLPLGITPSVHPHFMARGTLSSTLPSHLQAPHNNQAPHVSAPIPWLNPTCPDSVKGSVLYNPMCVLETQRVNKSQTRKSQGPCLSFCICSTVMRNENCLYSAYY